MLNSKRQAEDYAKALPTSHGWPPFILLCDVGHCIEVFADFSGQGKNYTQFPDRQSFRIYLEDLRKFEVQDRVRRIWTDPHSLDPTRKAARATREIAKRLAAVSKALEAKGHPAEEVALFLMRCLFTMFAEDVGLLPESSFSGLLADCRTDERKFVPLVEDLWRTMNTGGFAASIREHLRQFNGNLFANARALPAAREEIGELAAAAEKDWREVEPAIFGTLLEQALDPAERRRLGAHYTPRTYVERLVVATVIEPLRDEWRDVQGSAEAKRATGDRAGAAADVEAFHGKLCETRVLDPACGTGNFLYVTLELMKRLEGEVLEALVDLGGQEVLTGLGGHTVDPHQFIGMEINPRAAAIAELVLWIGYLQWHFRTKGGVPLEPILRAFKNIEVKDAILTWDGYPARQIVDGVEVFRGARRPTWPTAEFIIGKPPFIAGQNFREQFGNGYAEALWRIHRDIPGGADFVMFWWDRAAEILTQKGSVLRRFGLVTTSSITQEFSGRVIARRIKGSPPVSLTLAIPNHPWTRATAGAAAVRIAMTVAERGHRGGVLLETISEAHLETDDPSVGFRQSSGRINPNLTVGADLTAAGPLTANDGMCHDGVKLHGRGFIVRPGDLGRLGIEVRPGASSVLRPYLNGRDINQISRRASVIDLFGLTSDEVRSRFPEIYQHVLATVKPERDQNRRASRRDNWWLFGENQPRMRNAVGGLGRYIATVDTSRHRIFQFLPETTICDDKVVIIASAEPFVMAVLSSRVHCTWALKAGVRLGIGNDPVYASTRCFDPFPFPNPSNELRREAGKTAEELDAFRKQRQAEHPGLTLTQMYNALEAIRSGRPLTADEDRSKEQGLVLVLKELHDTIDRLIFEAYGWPLTLSDEEILAHLLELNKERAAEEKRGLVRWLRSEYQIPRFGRPADKQAAAEIGTQASATLQIAEPKQKPSFPMSGFEQSAAVFAALASAAGPVDAATIAARFRQGKKVEGKVADLLLSLSRLGYIYASDGTKFATRRVA
jgi:hypothetical protein